MKDGVFVSAVIGKPFGVKGELKAASFSGETSHLERLKFFTLRKGGAEKRYEVEGVRLLGDALAVKFVGVDSPEDARSLTGSEVVVPREDAAPLLEGEHYIEDLKGLRLRGTDGADYGVTLDVVEAGGGDLLLVRLTDGSERLVPFVDKFVGKVDTEGGFIELMAAWILE